MDPEIYIATSRVKDVENFMNEAIHELNEAKAQSKDARDTLVQMSNASQSGR